MSKPLDSVAATVATPRDESFVGRWSRRKRAEPEKREVEDARVAALVERQREQQRKQQRLADEAARVPAPLAPSAPPADLPAIESLTPESDYSRFMKADVPLASRNAAMKKLFADPHFNVMDGLDTYIDDYTKADPIPESMLRGLAQSRMLKLFNYDKEDAEDAAELARLRAERAAAEGHAAESHAAEGQAVDGDAGICVPDAARAPDQVLAAPDAPEAAAPARAPSTPSSKPAA